MRTVVRTGWFIIAGTVLGAVLFGCTPASDTPRVGFYNLDSQRLEGETKIVVKGVSGYQKLSVLVTVEVDGRVAEAQIANNFGELDPAPALAAVRRWRFRPQSFEGKPVAAVGTVSVEYTPPEDMGDTSIPFPQSAPADTEITLERTACFGSCPDYEVSIRGDGTVRFSTRSDTFSGTAAAVHRQFDGDGVLLAGTHVAHVDPSAVALLARKFRDAHFFGLKSSYQAEITDNPTYALTYRAGKASKRVVDYVGRAVGMPAVVSELEDAVDAVADTDRWISGDAGTIPALEGEGFDFRSRLAAEFAAAAMQMAYARDRTREVEPMIIALIDKGMPLDTKVGSGIRREVVGNKIQAESQASVGSVLIYEAALAGAEQLFERLDHQGWTARMSPRLRDQAFASGSGCNPTIAKMLARAGAEPRAAGESGTSLTAIRMSWGACQNAGEQRMLEMAKVLIDLGVPLEAHDDLGWTALMGCDSPELARLLLARGANVNARAKDGTTPVLATDDDRVALILLRAGADPRAKDENGSVREQAIKQHMPATLAWLDAHGIR